MEFKSGCGWRCCYDPETGLYTAEIGVGTNHNLYEITEEVYDLADASDAEGTKALIRTGRHLYMTVNDRCGLPYTVVLDSDYKKLCPWAETVVSGEIWDEDLTDAAVELFESEEKNRDQRRAKRAERQAVAKESKKKKKDKQIRLPAEYTDGALNFKTGPGWKACFDSKRNLYTAETIWAGYYDLYEIGEELFDKLKTKGMVRRDAHALIHTGRHLYKSVSDRNGSYDIALDENYALLCPWADVQKTGELWNPELTDLAVAVFDSEKQNREQRLKR